MGPSKRYDFAVTGVFVIIIALGALYVVWRFRYGVPSREVPSVVCFHKISRRFCWEGTWTTPGRFFEYVDRLRDAGHRFVGEAAFLDSLDSPSVARANEVFLTFDDGYAEIYDQVLPGLESRGVPLHVFLISDFVGRENTWDLSLGRRSFRHLS